MLKFKKTNISDSPSSRASSPRRPALVTRIDSMGGPVEHERVSLFKEDEDDSFLRSGSGSSAEEFDTPDSKLRDITKKKLNKQKKNILKQKLLKEKNLLSSKDFFNRQHELKIWVHETTGKDAYQLSDKKLKEYFKKFKDKWNKKKLPQKYYRGVDFLSTSIASPSVGDQSLCENQQMFTDSVISTNSRPSSELWIAPPIPMLSDMSSDELYDPPLASPATTTHSAVSTSNTIGALQRFATISKCSPGRPSQRYLEETVAHTRTPPKPPARGRPSAVLTTLKKAGSTESISSICSTSSNMRTLRPRMGSTMASLRHPSSRLPCHPPIFTGSSQADTEQALPSISSTDICSDGMEGTSDVASVPGGEPAMCNSAVSAPCRSTAVGASEMSDTINIVDSKMKVDSKVSGDSNVPHVVDGIVADNNSVTDDNEMTSTNNSTGDCHVLNITGGSLLNGATSNNMVEGTAGDCKLKGTIGNSMEKETTGDGAVKGSAGDSIVEGTARDCTVKGTTGDGMVTETAGDGMVEAIASDGMVTETAGDGMVEGIASDGLVKETTGGGMVRETAGDSRVEEAAGGMIVSGTTGDIMVERAAVDRIVSGTAGDGIVRETGDISTHGKLQSVMGSTGVRRRSAEKRSSSQLIGKTVSNTLSIAEPINKKRTIWVEEVENSEEVYV